MLHPESEIRPPAPPIRVLLATLGVALLWIGCAGTPEPGGIPFRGPGRLLLILESEALGARLVVADRRGVRTLPVREARHARFIGPDELLVVVEVPAREEFRLPETRLVRVDLATGERRYLGEPGHYFDPEPSPDGAWLAVGADLEGIGDSDLVIWSLEGEPEPVGVRHQSLDEPRWRHDGYALVASQLMPDPESDESGGGVLGTSFSWPRLVRLRRDLGRPSLLFDGSGDGRLAAGGSLPLWWSRAGLYARQRRGLVRCDPEAGRCDLVHSPGPQRRVVDGRPIGDHRALLLTVEASDAFDRRRPDEIREVDLRTGVGRPFHRTPPGVYVTEIDWIDAP